MEKYFISIDLGATSGRVMLVRIGEKGLEMETLHSFENRLLHYSGHYYWDLPRLFEEVKQGLRCAARKSVKIESVGVDSWGVDFVAVGKDGQLLGNPVSYRDPYTDGVPERIFSEISRSELYAESGIQILNFNTIFQLRAQSDLQYSPLMSAEKILFIPNAVAFLLTGKMTNEYTIFSTSGLLNPYTREPDESLLRAAGVSRDLFARTLQPGERIGELTPEVQAETGLPAVPVIAVASHDTASAVIAVPAADDDFAYLSSGTWSLLGVETRECVINKETENRNFTNEGGIEHTIRFLKNITGMWLLEQSRLQWKAEGKDYSYAEITAMADAVLAQGDCDWLVFDPDDRSLAAPTDMPQAISALVGTALSDMQTAAAIYLSLVRKYALVLNWLRELTGNDIRVLHVIGGGAQNDYLNQLIADEIGLPVVAGPVEATVVGNAIVQAQAAGLCADLKEARRLIRQSIPTRTFLPRK